MSNKENETDIQSMMFLFIIIMIGIIIIITIIIITVVVNSISFFVFESFYAIIALLGLLVSLYVSFLYTPM